MSELDPAALFEQISNDIPSELHQHLYVVGSLAAAYHFQGELERRAVNTKDADIIVHPAGDVQSSRDVANRLLAVGWLRHEECYPKTEPEPSDDLRAIRLFPPNSKDYFVEFLGLPEIGQQAGKIWLPVRLGDGWYGLPSFRFSRLTSVYRLSSSCRLEYAAPEMMALANLLSHRELTDARMESSGPMRGRFRCSKDLGRVIAIAILAGREATEQWPQRWRAGLEQCFPDEWMALAVTCGKGMVALLNDPAKFRDAWETATSGLLSGRGVTSENFKVLGERLVSDAIEPFENMANT